MSGTHANSRFPVFGVSLLKLPNNRFRITVRCDVVARDKSWYYANRDNFWKDFGDLYDSELTIDGATEGWEPHEGETYPDMRLIDTDFDFITGRNAPVLTFIYETISDTFVQTKNEDIDVELNGLRRVTRELIARPTTTYTKVVGTDSIAHQIDGEATKTLYLASFKVNSGNGVRRVTEVWLEAGQISETITGRGDGLTDTSKTFFHTAESTPAGSVLISRTDQNVDGFPTITTVWRSIPASSFSYNTTVDFTIPGVVKTETLSLSATQVNDQLDVSPPVPTTCAATVTIVYQTTSSITTTGLYQPSRWTQAKITGISSFGRPFSSTSTFMNHIRVGSGISRTQDTVAGGTVYYIQGNRIFGGTTGRIQLEGPTADIAGTTITLSIRLDPAFTTQDGTKYYKKTTVTVDVPARGSI